MDKRYAVFQLLGIGWYIVVALGLGLGGGIWLDGIVGTAPLFTLIGIFLGMAVAGIGAFRMVIRATAPSNETGNRTEGG